VNSSLFNSAADWAADGNDVIFNIAAFSISALAAIGAVAILVWINRR
jgi:hypothetical protein